MCAKIKILTSWNCNGLGKALKFRTGFNAQQCDGLGKALKFPQPWQLRRVEKLLLNSPQLPHAGAADR